MDSHPEFHFSVDWGDQEDNNSLINIPSRTKQEGVQSDVKYVLVITVSKVLIFSRKIVQTPTNYESIVFVLTGITSRMKSRMVTKVRNITSNVKNSKVIRFD